MNVHQTQPYPPLALYIDGHFVSEREGEAV
jgi:hypothetical protein